MKFYSHLYYHGRLRIDLSNHKYVMEIEYEVFIPNSILFSIVYTLSTSHDLRHAITTL